MKRFSQTERYVELAYICVKRLLNGSIIADHVALVYLLI